MSDALTTPTFDVDVCAPPGGVDWVPAAKFYTQEDDGLAQRWEGRVWMNPPYSLPEPWIDRFMQHQNGVCLVPCSNGRWFHRLWMEAHAVALAGPTAVKFVNGTGGGIPIRVVLAAYGQPCVDALRNIGAIRVVG